MPYIINVGNTTKPETFQLGVDFLRMEIERTSALGVAKQIVLHRSARWCWSRCWYSTNY